MELALYCPIYGYYETERDSIGTGGDYYTSVSVGPLFGEMLAFEFGRWLEECGVAAELKPEIRSPKSEMQGVRQIVEAGAHGGELARDILRWVGKNRPELFARLEYWIVEPSERRRKWQQRNLGEFATRVRWVRSLAELTEPCHPSPAAYRPGGVRGVIFSNELLDAMPVRRLGWDARQRFWFEWGVKVEGGRFVWTRMLRGSPKSEIRNPKEFRGPKPESRDGQTSRVEGVSDGSAGQAAMDNPFPTLSEDLLAVLPDGFTVEVSPAAEEWWREAASVLESGRLVTVDYGLTAEEFFAPERPEGTLRAYRQHRASKDVLANPGEQDITAHVNFTAIREVGELAGLKTEGFVSQAQFLTGIAAQIWKGEASFGEWGAEQTRQFQTLTHPEHLGRAFRVLVQSRPAQGDCSS